MKTVALQALKVLITRQINIIRICKYTNERVVQKVIVGRVQIDTSCIKPSCCSLSLKVLCLSKKLNHFKVVIAADEDKVSIILGDLTIRTVRTIFRQFIANGKLGRAVFT